jgi:hypothetical protein
MATAKQRQFSVSPSTGPGHRAAEPRRTAVFAGGAVAVALAAALLAVTGPGAAAAVGLFRFLEFYCGVFCLVALSLTIMVGLAATDRVVLLVRHRVMMQGVHRAVATMAMVFLGLHVATKVIEGHASPLDVLVPFLSDHRPFAVGLGTLAGYLMVGVTVTGVTRGRFAGSPRVWLWRTLHAGAYLCWPVALLHGLGAGRAAKPWVTTSYAVCVVLVALALIARGFVSYGSALRGPRTKTTATLRPVGKISSAATSIAVGPTGGAATSAGASHGARHPGPPPIEPGPIGPGPIEPAWRRDTGANSADVGRRSGGPARRSGTAAREAAPTSAPPPLPAPGTISDDDFWAFMRGEGGR